MPHLMASRCSADDIGCVCTVAVCTPLFVCVCLQFFAKSLNTSSLPSLSTGVSAAAERDRGVRNVRSKVKGKRDRRWKRTIRLDTVEMSGFLHWFLPLQGGIINFWLRSPSPSRGSAAAAIGHFLQNTIRSSDLCICYQSQSGCKVSPPWQTQ